MQQAAAEAQATSDTAEGKAAARTYAVKSGSTLSGIAYDMYGDAGRWPSSG